MELVPMILRGLQLLFVVILTALIGNVIASNNNGSESAINFSMFVIVLSWLATIAGLAFAFLDRLSIPVVTMGLDGLATLFTFIDAIVLAAKLGAVNCSNTAGHGSGWIAYGSSDDEKRCREIQASTAFMWFLWATFTATLVLFMLGFRRGGGSVRSSVPTMSHVRGV